MTGAIARILTDLDPEKPVLVAGPTASGKSALALAIAEAQGGVIVNADAIQVFDDWRVLTARPGPDDLARARHALYGHVPGAQPYSVGAWLRDLAPVLRDARPIVTGGTGLYFAALTEGLADIPATPPDLRARSDSLLDRDGLDALVGALDRETRARIDLRNPRRVQRAWEVLHLTGRGIAAWQDATPPPLLPIDRAQPLLVEAPRDWLSARIARRFETMLQDGALDEARRNRDGWRPDLPSAKAIGAAELMAYLDGEIDLSTATERAIVLTRQFAKRQRTWFRARMTGWRTVDATTLG